MTETKRRIYLDHAATSWPKSDSVLSAIEQFMREGGAAAGRGGYQSAIEADRVVVRVRRLIAQLIGVRSPERVTFHANGTAALNAAIHGIVRAGDHVVTSAAEHNSVLRPLHFLEQTRGVRLSIVPTDNNGTIDAGKMLEAVDQDTRLVALTHASNVTGAVQPIAEVGRALATLPTLFLCDAAQTFGTLPIDVGDWNIDLLAAPGHKSSGGPLGTGFLFLSDAAANDIQPIVQGGTGTISESLEMPGDLPTMLEAGNLNVPALAGWLAALQEFKSETAELRQRRSQQLSERLHEGLAEVRGLRVFGSAGPLPIASVAVEGLEPSDLAAILDSEFGIETRSGLHCAALIHSCIGSGDAGTLRISAGHDSSDADIDAVVAAMNTITAGL